MSNEDLLEDAKLYKELERTTWQRADLAQKYNTSKEDLELFAKESEENINTLKQYARVARTYEENNRLFSRSFKHYMVAMSNPARLEWLRQAEENKWTVKEMMDHMNPPKVASPIKDKEIKPVTKEESIPPEDNPIKQIPPLKVEPEVKRRHSWDPPEITPLEAGFKPFIESWNMCYTLKALDGKTTEEIILFVFGMQDTYKLSLDPDFGYRIIPLKIKEGGEGPIIEGPSQ